MMNQARYCRRSHHIQVIPEKYSKYKLDPIDEFFAMGRGLQKPQSSTAAAVDVPALVREPVSLESWYRVHSW